MTERRPPASGGETAMSASFSDATSTSDALARLPPRSTDAGASIIMEGMLKKRGANLPVMRDRYCVATWATDASQRQYVLLRTYKTQKSFAKSPEKPASEHELKCFGEWDGKGNFHRYDHAFLMETRDSKVFFCVAPSDAAKRQWIDVMKTATATGSSHSSSTDVRPSIAKQQSAHRNELSERSLFGHDSDDEQFTGNGGVEDDDDAQSATDSEQSPDDGLFRSSSGADSVLSASDRGGASKAEPADWGIYGDSADRPTVSRYDIVDRPVLLLDEELLAKPDDKAALASDAFLFDDASRFGAVVVPKAQRASDDDLADFVDETLAARLEREKSEKKLRRRAQKLESNRDLYAEMAAARLNSMRKDARHPPKKSPREVAFRPSQFVGDAPEYTMSDDGYSHMTEIGFDHHSASDDDDDDDLFGNSHAATREAPGDRRSSMHKQQRRHGAIDDDDDTVAAVELHTEDALADNGAEPPPPRARKSAMHRNRESLVAPNAQPSDGQTIQHADDLSERSNEDNGAAASDAPTPDDHDVNAEVQDAPPRKRKSKHKRPLASHDDGGDEADDAAPFTELVVVDEAFASGAVDASELFAVDDDENEAAAAEAEAQRRLEKERRREERRARREQQRQEEEEAAAAAAAELARQHRDAMREREEEKARKREKKERRERRERAKAEKEKKQRRAKEAELQAEVERLRLAQLQQRAEDEKKEKKKNKRREKERYSTPAERIQRKEREAEAHAAAAATEMSSALVLVETPAPVDVSTPVAASESVPVVAAVAPAVAAAPSVAVSGAPEAPAAVAASPAAVVQPSAPVPTAAVAPALIPVTLPHGLASATVEQSPASASVPSQTPPLSQPSYPMMPQYVPGYPAPPQSLPLYASASYGAYQYPPQAYYPPPYASMAYAPGMPMAPPQFFQPPPPLGYMPGAPPSMMAPAAYPPGAYPGYGSGPAANSASPSANISTTDEPAFIGPKLPSPRTQAASSSSAAIGPPPPPPGTAPRPASPALPDLPDLPDIADF